MLSDTQLEQFATDGYLVVPGVIDEAFLVAADHEVDELVAAEPPPPGTVGPHFWFLPPGRLPASHAAFHRSAGTRIADELVAPGHLDDALDHVQVALNLPPFPHRPGGPHIDGHRPDQTEPASFTLLAAVFLGDETAADTGNLWVWPGSHLAHQDLFRQRGTDVLLPVSGHSTLLSPPFALGPPVPVLAQRGDLLLAHFLLGHNIGGNTGDTTRRILYYRLAVDGHATRWQDTFLDAWTEYPPLRGRPTSP